ncbi:alpha/beta hydrolase [Mycolicibacter heraklionensis]|uniref:alpha/beta fold hydrolase n=1 Tax=Mycolicibacter heraklionensis TaxID=512402 RepID=UPI0009EEC244|nr:alpha/beta hydrolase [Mycolicibacter heraklionensis]
MTDVDAVHATQGSGLEPDVSRSVRRAFGVLEWLAPRLGARWAIELWCTPPEAKSTRMPPGTGAGEAVEASWSGHHIVGEAWGEGPTVYLVHGWGGCRAHLGVFVKPLVAAGHRVVAFDLPSHHESGPGELAPGRTTIAECGRAVQAMVDAHGPARAVVAHSLGAKATALAMSWGTPAERLVFLAPMGGFAHYLDWFARRHGFGPRIRDALHRRLDRRLGFPLLHADLPHLASCLEDPPPLLIVHDPDDPDSPFSASEELVSVWPGASVTATNGLGRLAHYRIMRNPQAVRAAVAFIGSAPSS